MHFTEICACLDHAWLFDIFLSVLGIVRWVCSVPSQMKQIHFFLWLRFLFICIANMRPGAVQVRVWNTVDQWPCLEFVVGQTQIYIASEKDLAPKQRLLFIESQDLLPVKTSQVFKADLILSLFFFWNLKETQAKKQHRPLEWEERHSAVFQSIYPLFFF